MFHTVFHVKINNDFCEFISAFIFSYIDTEKNCEIRGVVLLGYLSVCSCVGFRSKKKNNGFTRDFVGSTIPTSQNYLN